MKKASLLLVSLFSVACLLGCGNNGTATNSNEIKSVFLDCKEKTDVVKDSISELSMEESSEYAPPKSIHRAYQGTYGEMSKNDYLTWQNFGLYILNNVYHCVTFGYESENVPIDGTLIKDEVRNELDGNSRETLKQSGQTNPFYMVIAKNDTGYVFDVDWLGEAADRGTIFVRGDVGMLEGKATKFNVSCYTEPNFVFAAHYDFVQSDFYQILINSDKERGPEPVAKIIEGFNNASLSTDDINECDAEEIAIASGKITSNLQDIHYQGYYRRSWSSGSDKSSFDRLLGQLLSSVSSLKIRTKSQKLDYGKCTNVHFVDAALQYGLNVTKLCVTREGSAVYPYVDCDKLTAMCEGVPEKRRPVFNKLRAELSAKGTKEKITGVEGNEILFHVILREERYDRQNTYNVDSLEYSLFDKTEGTGLYFGIKGDQIINIREQACLHQFQIDEATGAYLSEGKNETYIDYGQAEGAYTRKYVTTTFEARCDHCREFITVEKWTEAYLGRPFEFNPDAYGEDFDGFDWVEEGIQYYTFDFNTYEFFLSGEQFNELEYLDKFDLFYPVGIISGVYVDGVFQTAWEEKYEYTFKEGDTYFEISGSGLARNMDSSEEEYVEYLTMHQRAEIIDGNSLVFERAVEMPEYGYNSVAREQYDYGTVERIEGLTLLKATMDIGNIEDLIQRSKRGEREFSEIVAYGQNYDVEYRWEQERGKDGKLEQVLHAYYTSEDGGTFKDVVPDSKPVREKLVLSFGVYGVAVDFLDMVARHQNQSFFDQLDAK